MIDWDRVVELRAEVGEEAFAEVVEIFLEEVQEVVERLAAAVSAPVDAATLAADLHFLKGSALNLGFAHLAARCAVGEASAAAGDAAAVDLSALLACYEASRQAFLRDLPARLGQP